MAAPLIQPRSPPYVRAQRLGVAAREALNRLDQTSPLGGGGNLFAALGECLVWLIALEDLVREADEGQYQECRGQYTDGAVMPGLRFARNAVVHGERVATVTTAEPGAEPGRLVLGRSPLGTVSGLTWAPRSTINFEPNPSPFVPAQKQSYETELAGRDIGSALHRALGLLVSLAGI